jgi:hypothetical protein
MKILQDDLPFGPLIESKERHLRSSLSFWGAEVSDTKRAISMSTPAGKAVTYLYQQNLAI